ncbi:damage-control phosphatase ARMT1 isoform X2 [Manduca sexta]|uniref:damage-control phosphatase ARMT1 isoform X2 n=1 Tax=Manduca sexta TaxID=7130 RepID=UPI00188E01FF|nr:damage-control phosphatase ARMT1 isoform X2 [Manduca sexta]
MSSNANLSRGSSGTGGDNENDWSSPDFIYGGPFIKVEKARPFLDTATPINLELQGTFKKSFAYYSLKERLPIILTKIIDYCSREGSKIKSSNSASDEDVRSYIQYITKLKNDLMTNKKYDLLTEDTAEAKLWNQWIQSADNQYYFTNTWVFTECYVYRRLREGCELSKGLKNFDPFEEQKQTSFTNSLEVMCVVAERLTAMLPESDKDKRKADFITLLKICLWANKCDLSLSMGEQVSLKSKDNIQTTTPSATDQKGGQKPSATQLSDPIDPFQMIIDFKDKLLVDDSGKIADQVIAKAEAMAKAVEGPPSAPGSAKGSAPPSPPPEGEPAEEVKIPCPTKMVVPQAVMFDIVCDNSGYELFADLCLAHFLISQKIVQKIRFHVKKMPWFVSDVTPRDFKFVVDSCAKASFNRQLPSEPKPEPPEGEAPPEVEPPKFLTSDKLKEIGEQWARYVEDGTFIVLCDDFWTYPHVYRDMKKYDYNMYRKLQYAVAVLFKGDLNYRKLLGERNVNPTVGFEAALQGFMPAPVIALRTVKADLICGLPKGKWELLTKTDDKWMQTGDYGVIQFCPKAEPLKPADRPCADYGDTCRGVVCPVHKDL